MPLRRNVRVFPEVGFRILEDVVVNPRSVGILAGDGVHPRRPVSPDDLELGPLTVPNHRTNDGHQAVVAWRRAQPVDAAIFLGGMWSDNYYHWMTDHLPLLYLAGHLPGALRGLPLIVSRPALDIPSIRASIDLLGDGRRVITGAPWQTFHVGRLVVIDPPKLVTAVIPGEPSIHGVEAYHAEVMRGFRAELLRRLGVTDRPDPSAAPVLVVRPSDSRRTYNKDEVLAALRPLGFTAVETGGLPLREQARLFRCVPVIAGPSGAALANLLFTAEPTRAVVWGDWRSGDPMRAFWANLAAVGGASVTHLGVRGIARPDRGDDDDVDYWSVDPKAVVLAAADAGTQRP